MGQEITVPDWAQKAPAQAFAKLNPQDDSLSEGIGQSYPVIGYKGKVWSLRHRGERHNFIRPDDGTPSAYLDVIILGQAKQKSKSYYKKFDQSTSDGDRPICSSIDGLVPDPDVTTKQCDTCALCPKNVWKTDPATGRKGRECTDYKRLAVLVLPTQTKPLLGTPLMEPAFLRVPPASLNSLAIMGDSMANRGFHYSSYITRITFDQNKSHPEMQFRPLQGLTDQEAPVILPLREDPSVNRIISGGYSEGVRPVAPQEGTTLLPPGQHSTGIVLDNPPQNSPSTGGQIVQEPTSTPQKQTTGGPIQAGSAPGTGSPSSVSAQPATPAPAQAAQASSAPNPSPQGTGLVDTGFGGVTTAQAQPEQVQQTVGDTGAPEATDQDLDARIAGLIKK